MFYGNKEIEENQYSICIRPPLPWPLGVNSSFLFLLFSISFSHFAKRIRTVEVSEDLMHIEFHF